jgi:hypothetical protein
VRSQAGFQFDVGPDLTVIAECPERAPFSPNLTILEEDTHRVLSARSFVVEQPGSLGSALEAVARDTRARPGSVIRRRRSLLAIVHELSADPTCRADWIDLALRAAFAEADRDRARTVALPLLGTVHGRIPESTSFALFKGAIASSPRAHLERIWLVVPRDRLDAVAALL